MQSVERVHLRRTTVADLDFVLALEHRPGQSALIGQWPREKHVATMARADREHWIIEREDAPLGYLIAYDVRAAGYGVYIKRIAVSEPSHGIGRQALQAFIEHAFRDLSADAVCLAVREYNERAQRAYLAVGFQPLSQTPAERKSFLSAVDRFPDNCLIMRVASQKRTMENMEERR